MEPLRSKLDQLGQMFLFDFCVRHQSNCVLAVDMINDDVHTCCVQRMAIDDDDVTVDRRCPVYYRATLPALTIADTLIDSSSDENGPIVGGHEVNGGVGDAELEALVGGVDDMEVERDAIELFTNLCREQGIDI